MPREAREGMAWLHNVEVREEFIAALDLYIQNTGATRKEAIEWALGQLPTYKGAIELPGWAEQIKTQFIDKQQPFALNYRDSSDRTFSWTIQYAEFTTHEKRTYMDFWANETEQNQDLEPLQHNWCVRLDRIVSVEPVPASGEWRDRLDTIDIEFHLYNGLSYAYSKETNGFKAGDIVSERLDANTRRVVRKVSSTFWFLREISAYLGDCLIISPSDVRQLVLAKAQKWLEKYKG